VSLSTGTGFVIGSPLWLQIEQGGGSGKTLLDNIQIVQIPIISNPPDINGDGLVNFQDIEIMACYWLYYCFEPHWCIGADLNISGSVDWLDVETFTQSWLGVQ
jgi:hypothetical protein